MTSPTTWRKSSYSANVANCVELATTGDPAVRDSKNPDAGHLALDRPELAAWIDACRAGDLDALAE